MDSAWPPQAVLSSSPQVDGQGKRLWLDERIFPFYAAAISLFVLVLRAIWTSKAVRHLRGQDVASEEPLVGGFVERRGGITIFLFKWARLDGVLALFATVLWSTIRSGRLRDWVSIADLVCLDYVTGLAIANVFVNARLSKKLSLHLTLVSLTWLMVYAYRDVWPLMTFTIQPKDGKEGALIWLKIAFATFVAVIEPLLEPYPYVPSSPAQAEEPSPEETASLFSFITFLWLDPTIRRAYHTTHLSTDELPPLSKGDETKTLIKRAFPTMDPFSGGKARHLFWAYIKIFRKSLAIQAAMLVFYALANIAIPIGTNRLLNYIEKAEKDAIVKPWVWILWMGGGPIVQTFVMQCYLYNATRTLVQMESIITSLVFDHALRMRIKAETNEKTVVPEAAVPSSDAAAGPGQAKGDDEDEGGDSDTVHSRATTGASTTHADAASTATSTTAAAPGASPQPKGTEDQKAGAAKEGSNLTGKINNLVTSDLANITAGRNFLYIALEAPLQFTLGMVFLYTVLGWSAFVGLAVMVALIPVPAWVTARLQGVQKDRMKASDARVQSVTEVVSVLRMVKLFGWEPRVKENIAKARDDELNYIWKRKILNTSSNCVNHVIPLMHMVVTYAVYTAVMKQKLTASIVFSSMTAFDIIRGQIFRVTFMLPTFVNASVSLGRIGEFLRKTELLDEFTGTSAGETVVDASEAHTNDIGFGRANFSWTNEKEDGSVTPSRQTFRLRIDDEVYFKKGAFNLIIGPTASGKTSVLMALLGEMHYIPLVPDSWKSLPREGGVAYAAQESWVLNETIKENILFGAPLDEERYKKVIYQCGLTRDLSLFEAGDATEVGEKGLTLSGGQKARVTLARAVYLRAETLLLDDVLAALDVHTARWIINKCFKGDLVRGRTVILVTHNVAMASPLAEFVVSLRDGHIVSQGSVSEALQKDPQLEEEYKHEEEAIDLDEAEEAVEASPDPADPGVPDKKDGKLVVAEEMEIGHVGWDAFKLYLQGLGGRYPFLFWLQFTSGEAIVELFTVLEVWWLGYWAGQYALRDPSDVHVDYYLGMYCAFVGVVILANVYSQIVWAFATLRASRSIHAQLVKSLLGSTFRWLDVTPTSRITARCTQDIQAVDGSMPGCFYSNFSMALACIIKLGVVLTFTPLFLLPAVFVIAFGAFLGQVYMKAQLSIKREMSTAKAPVLGAFGGAVAGLSSIRAYHAQDAFRNLLHQRIDRYTRGARSFYNVYRWIAIRLDVLGQVFAAAIAVYLVYGPLGTNASIVGFTLTQAAGFSELILWFMYLYNEFEINGNSLERIKQYLDIEHEPEATPDGVPPAYWPSSGDLRVEKLSARYSADGPVVLQDVSFHAKAGERVGIVGRTGSGKSTLTLALLRCIPTEGTVLYDGLDTKAVNLDALRSSVTIIPQVPELLAGTLRHNLDMFGAHDDATLNAALRAAGLFALQSRADDARLTLDTPVAGAGGNLSVGQRQIVALARAIVRGSKLLVLDEATSAIDYETDAVIQASLRTALARDVTVITVAHRLQTIMDYDKIMVLDAGRLVEYDAPQALLRTEGSFLRALVDESADREALYAMAEGKAQL